MGPEPEGLETPLPAGIKEQETHPPSRKLSAGRGTPTHVHVQVHVHAVPNSGANCAQISQETLKREEYGRSPGSCDHAEGFGGQKAVRGDDWRDRGHSKAE